MNNFKTALFNVISNPNFIPPKVECIRLASRSAISANPNITLEDQLKRLFNIVRKYEDKLCRSQ